jgi:CDP-diacylglycerol--glycerol-3-phosphate 3-phosphatidyltransferase
MNLPNQLTTSRILMTFALLGVMFSGLAYRESIALVLFVIAGFTDYLDGQIARKRQLITNFGILMDPLADKVLICSVFIAFVELRQMAAWMVIVIVARELAITGLRLLAASKNVVLAAEGLGKHKTVSQMVSITAVMISMSYPQWGDWARAVFEKPILWGPWSAWFTEVSKWVAVILTLWSGTFYLWRNREIYLKDS